MPSAEGVLLRGGRLQPRSRLGISRTGLALSEGFSIRPLTVLELRGQTLELRLLDIAEIQWEFLSQVMARRQSNQTRFVVLLAGLQFEHQKGILSFFAWLLSNGRVLEGVETMLQQKKRARSSLVPAPFLRATSGIAEIMERRFGTLKLPYSQQKSLAGSISIFLFGFLVSIR